MVQVIGYGTNNVSEYGSVYVSTVYGTSVLQDAGIIFVLFRVMVYENSV